MSQPYQFTTVSDAALEDRDFIPLARCKGRLLVVRPLEYQREGFTTRHKPDGTDVVFCDIALLDPIDPATDLEGNQYPGYPAGHQFRNQAVLQGYLKGTFKRYIGATLIGTVYRGTPTKGQPPIMWQDLSGDPNCVMRGQRFMAAHPEFLVPVAVAITEAAPEPTGFQGYTPPPQAAPVSPAPVQPYSGYQQPDPWSQDAAAPVSPAQRPMTTLEQMRNMGQVNHRGEPQSSDIPF